MFKKPHSQSKAGNIAKIKYFLPSSAQNRYEQPEHEQSRLNKIKRSINSKYKASHSTSKPSSKRPSVTKIQRHGESVSSQINLNDDISFQIVGIRDAQQTSKTNTFGHKNYKYPLGQANVNLSNLTHNKSKQINSGAPFTNIQEKNNISQSSKALQNISKLNDFQKMAKNFPKPEQKAQFQRFLQNLKRDQNYQNTITMFTIMYFYEQKAKKK